MFIIVKKKDLLLGSALVLSLGVYALFSLLPTSVATIAPARAGEEHTIVIDAGHGGEDGGAVSANGVIESGINLAVAQDLDMLLTLLGEDTVMTRTEDVSVYSEGAQTLRQKKRSDLENRVALVNGTPNAVLLSIHQNSLPKSTRTHGAQVFFGGIDGSDALAQSVQTALNSAINDGDKEAKRISSDVFLMKNVTVPAVLVECGFLSNPEETAKLQQPDYQTKLAVVIAAGFLNTQEKQGTGEGR